MPSIGNFSQDLMDRHMNWHMHAGHPEMGGRAIDPWPPGGGGPAPGSGQEFLTFHHTFLADFRSWYDGQQGHDDALIEPWTQIPTVLKVAQTGWNASLAAQEAQLEAGSFQSADELGRFVEWGIHGWLHTACARAFGEPVLGSPMEAPTSTYFYQLHGLIEHWWQLWQRHHRIFKRFDKREIKEAVKGEIKEIKESLKPEIKEHPEKPLKEKDKDKDLVEGGDPIQQIVDPAILASVAGRIRELEDQLSEVRSFIRPEERPDVGPRAERDDG